jgi:hypothetical protein
MARNINDGVVLTCVGPPEGGGAIRVQQRLTTDAPAWYAGTRARVEAMAVLEQAEELRRELEELGERLGE